MSAQGFFVALDVAKYFVLGTNSFSGLVRFAAFYAKNREIATAFKRFPAPAIGQAVTVQVYSSRSSGDSIRNPRELCMLSPELERPLSHRCE